MKQPSLLQRLFNNPLFMTLFYALFWGIGVYAAERGQDSVDPVFHVIVSLCFGAVMALLSQRRLRRFDAELGISSLAQRVTLQQSLKTASVPTDTTLRRLLPGYLDYIDSLQHKYQRTNRIVLPLLVLIYIGNAILHHSLLWILLGLVFVALIGWAQVASRRNRQNIPVLRAKLGASE